MRPVVVIGIGNALLRDEGIGGQIIRALQARLTDLQGVEFLDLGTGGLSLLHAISGRRKALLGGCGLLGEPSGTMRRFRPDAVRSRKVLPGLSLHEGDVIKLLALAAELGSAPGEVVIFGIQPADTSPGTTLSDTLQANFDAYVEQIADEVRASCQDSDAAREE